MEIAPIRTGRDYHRTLKEIESLMTAERGTPEGERLDVLVTLIESWEARRFGPKNSGREHLCLDS